MDEIKVSAGKIENKASYTTFPSTLLNTDNATFEKHLKSRSAAISSAISQVFSDNQRSTPEVAKLQERIAQLLLVEKENVNELEKIRLEKEQLDQRLETASMRYLMAEKRLDRAKSLTVAKLERQAIANSGPAAGSETAASKSDATNGQVDSAVLAEAESAKKEIVAASVKQAEQLDKLSIENGKLTAELTNLKFRLSHLTDDDYAHTDLFKQLKLQHEDVITRINGLEATNTELRKEAQKLLAERSAYRTEIDAESQAAIAEKELQLSKAEADLARIRTTRDELAADVNIRKAAQDQERTALNQMKQLDSAKDDRIHALESEVERLKNDQPCDESSEIQGLPLDELKTKYSDLERRYSQLESELASITAAYKKMSTMTIQKVKDFREWDQKVERANAEKTKADQKYFAAMKAKDAREQEIRALRAQNSKSSDIVSQLKDAEASTRALVVNLEKHIAESKDMLTSLETKLRVSQKQIEERDITVVGLRKQVEELKTSLIAKDNAHATVSSAHRKAEVEIEQLKVDVKEKEKRLEMYKSRAAGTEDNTADMLRVCFPFSAKSCRDMN